MTSQTREDCLIGMHLPRSLAELRTEAACHLKRVLPDRSMAVLFRGESTQEDLHTVELVIGNHCPLVLDSKVSSSAWACEQLRRFPIRYKWDSIGELLVEGEVAAEEAYSIDGILSHLAVAIVNIKLNGEALRSTDQYCASLQAFEAGVVLFKESNKETVGARFLDLMRTHLGIQAAALFILEEVGNEDSPLMLDQAMGVPEAMLEELRLPDQSWWPSTLLGGSLQCFVRQSDGSFPPLGGPVPPALTSIVAIPLRYHGVLAGLYLAFNVALDDSMMQGKLDSAQRLSELGAALFHRFGLEEAAVNERELKTQLHIAADIQRQFIPSIAPPSNSMDCAWQSMPAQFVGGDYLDLLSGSAGQVYSVIADVSGHGINSALLMSSFRSSFRSDCHQHRPAELLGKLNQEISHEVGDTGMFITAATFEIHEDGRHFSYASAGHNSIYLYRAENAQVIELESTGPSLGFFRSSTFSSEDYEIEPGDILLLYTDGIVEAQKAGNEFEMYGDERLQTCLREQAGQPAHGIMTAVVSDLKRFTASETFEDDVSLSVIKVL